MLVSNPQFKLNFTKNRVKKILKLTSIVMVIMTLISINKINQKERKVDKNALLVSQLPQLSMSGGNPYIRALMLTISASESNDKNSYFLVYGGDHVHNLTQHPNQCIAIKTKVNQGKCSTAAGRYQFLNFTWQEKASKYHPKPQQSNHGISYSFEPEYQDMVVYKWLKDHHQWDIEILTLLKQDRVEEVLTELSGVWTSVGGGIEDNVMTDYLPQLYRHFLAQELKTRESNDN